MTKATYFLQVCPTCGRRVRVRVEYMGKQVACQHCHGRFEARDPETTGMALPREVTPIIDRVDELLASADAWMLDQGASAPAMNVASNVLR
jgi:DNA-directed RNA polymerase subunit RPC12/RpoP